MQEGESDIVIVTSGYHVPRALLTARRLGLRRTYAYPAPYRTVSWPNYALRELLVLAVKGLKK